MKITVDCLHVVTVYLHELWHSQMGPHSVILPQPVHKPFHVWAEQKAEMLRICDKTFRRCQMSNWYLSPIKGYNICIYITKTIGGYSVSIRCVLRFLKRGFVFQDGRAYRRKTTLLNPRDSCQNTSSVGLKQKAQFSEKLLHLGGNQSSCVY